MAQSSPSRLGWLSISPQGFICSCLLGAGIISRFLLTLKLSPLCMCGKQTELGPLLPSLQFTGKPPLPPSIPSPFSWGLHGYIISAQSSSHSVWRKHRLYCPPPLRSLSLPSLSRLQCFCSSECYMFFSKKCWALEKKREEGGLGTLEDFSHTLSQCVPLLKAAEFEVVISGS